MKYTMGGPLLCWSTGGWKFGFKQRGEVCSSRCEFKMALVSSRHMPYSLVLSTASYTESVQFGLGLKFEIICHMFDLHLILWKLIFD